MGVYSFSKNEHLKRSSDIREVFQTGRKWVGDFIIFYTKASPDSSLKAAFVVSKKIGGAVVRNRIRRLMREAYRLQKPFLKKISYWFVFSAKAGVEKWEFSKIDEEMRRFFNQIQ